MRIFLAMLCSLQFVLAAAGQEVEAQVMPREVVVDPQTNTASALIVLRNKGTADADVILLADDFRAEGGVAGLGAKTLFGTGDEAPTRSELPVAVPKGGQQTVRAAISNLEHAGIARAALMNRGTPIGELVAVKTQLPFNVAPVGWKEGTPFTIHFEKGAGPLLFLKNDDPVDYLVTWTLSTPGLAKKQSAAPVRVQAQSTQEVQIPVDGWLPSARDVGALLKGLSSPGSLRLAATDAYGKRQWKTRDLGVTIERSYWSPTSRTLRSFLLLALLVALGGILSIVTTHGLPNRLRRIAVAESIKAITPKIRAISTAVESNLRTGVRVERTRLLQRLRSRSTISPDFANLVRECEAATLLLEREIDLLDRIDADMRRIETAWPTAGVHGPTLLQKACILLTDAQLALERPEMSDEVVSGAGALVQKAEATIENASTLDSPSMASVKERLARLEEAGAWKECEIGKKIVAQVPGLPAALGRKASDLTDANFASYDEASVKLDFVRRFVELCEKADDGDDKTGCIDQFIAALRRGGFNDFRVAERLTAQMREGVFPKQVTDEIRAGRYKLELEPQAPTVNQAVSFTVVFDHPGVNSSAARHALSCTWEFHHAPAPDQATWVGRAVRRSSASASESDWKIWTERGLSVSHYFPTAGKFDVAVRFKDETGRDVESPDTASRMKVDVEAERVGWFGERTKVEYSRLAIVLIITVAGLLVGARDELAKLDLVPGLIAVFMLGFTADQIKNILAPPSSP